MDYLQERLQKGFSYNDKNAVLLLLEDVEVLGIGKTRVAIKDNEDVIKLAWTEEGLRDNEIEYLLYNKASASLKPLLCPSKELSLAGSLRQARCFPIAARDLSAEGHNLVSRLSGFGLSDTTVNIGSLNDKLVCYDYSLLSPQLLGELLWENFYAGS
jgi:hypothetical protein